MPKYSNLSLLNDQLIVNRRVLAVSFLIDRLHKICLGELWVFSQLLKVSMFELMPM